MREERLKMKGRMADLNYKQKELRIQIKAKLRALRDLLDPYADLLDLKTDRIASLASDLESAHIQYVANEAMLKEIEADLNG